MSARLIAKQPTAQTAGAGMRQNQQLASRHSRTFDRLIDNLQLNKVIAAADRAQIAVSDRVAIVGLQGGRRERLIAVLAAQPADPLKLALQLTKVRAGQAAQRRSLGRVDEADQPLAEGAL